MENSTNRRKTGEEERGAERRIRVTTSLTTSRISNPLFLFNLAFVTKGQLAEQSSRATTKNELTFIIVIPNIFGCPMIKFISFCPKMINSTDFVNPTIMLSQ